MGNVVAKTIVDRFLENWLEAIDLVSLLSMLAIVFAATCWVYL
jgi:hypothetical protein